ncbi:MAG: hypothetical protein ACYDAA_19015 [Syntrophales bacterium]
MEGPFPEGDHPDHLFVPVNPPDGQGPIGRGEQLPLPHRRQMPLGTLPHPAATGKNTAQPRGEEFLRQKVDSA